MVTVDQFLIVVAIVLFFMAAFGVPRLRWGYLGFAAMAATLLF